MELLGGFISDELKSLPKCVRVTAEKKERNISILRFQTIQCNCNIISIKGSYTYLQTLPPSAGLSLQIFSHSLLKPPHVDVSDSRSQGSKLACKGIEEASVDRIINAMRIIIYLKFILNFRLVAYRFEQKFVFYIF